VLTWVERHQLILFINGLQTVNDHLWPISHRAQHCYTLFLRKVNLFCVCKKECNASWVLVLLVYFAVGRIRLLDWQVFASISWKTQARSVVAYAQVGSEKSMIRSLLVPKEYLSSCGTTSNALLMPNILYCWQTFCVFSSRNCAWSINCASYSPAGVSDDGVRKLYQRMGPVGVRCVGSKSITSPRLSGLKYVCVCCSSLLFL